MVEQISASSSSVTIVLANRGNAPAVDAFWVDVYLDPATPPTHVNQAWQDVGSRGLVWGIPAGALPLAPGAA